MYARVRRHPSDTDPDGPFLTDTHASVYGGGDRPASEGGAGEVRRGESPVVQKVELLMLLDRVQQYQTVDGVPMNPNQMARPEGLEPSTPGLEGRCSIQLSYGRVICIVLEQNDLMHTLRRRLR